MSIKEIKLLNPDFVITCSELKTSKQIYKIFRNMGITKSFVYGIIRQPTLLTYEFIKIGMSSPNLGERSYQVGERVVRQLSWVPGWSGGNPKTSNGLDFWMNLQIELINKNKLPNSFNKNMLKVAVWNVSSRMIESDFLEDQEKIATAWAEGFLARQHKDMYGFLPPLNYSDPSTSQSFKKAHINKQSFQSNFEIN